MKKFFKILLGIVIVGGIAIYFLGRDQIEGMQIGTAYAAQTLCSCVFVTEREPEACKSEQVGGAGQIPQSVDYDKQIAKAEILILKSTSKFEEGKGCTLQ
jgi:hypothetical protein